MELEGNNQKQALEITDTAWWTSFKERVEASFQPSLMSAAWDLCYFKYLSQARNSFGLFKHSSVPSYQKFDTLAHLTKSELFSASPDTPTSIMVLGGRNSSRTEGNRKVKLSER